MARGNFSACLPVTLAYEGGLSKNRADPGNWTGGKVGVGELRGTNFGIAASAHPTLDIAHLNQAEAASIYEREYWTPAGCETLPAGLDLCHFDGTVNSGHGASARWLTTSRTPDTVRAIHAYSTARLHSLQSFKTWATFGRGWGARVAGVEARALAMAGVPGEAIARAGTVAGIHAKAASAVAHVAAAASGASIVAVPTHPFLGILAGVMTAATAIWSAFHGSTAGSRAAVFAHGAANL